MSETKKKQLFEDWKMKPVIILPPNSMSPEDIAALRENHLCVVVADHPEAVKFVDPIPSVSSRTQIENAAISLSRKIMAPHFWNSVGTWNGGSVRSVILSEYISLLVEGSPLDPAPSQSEQEKKIFNAEKAEEIRRLAREEARAERAAAKKAASKEAKP